MKDNLCLGLISWLEIKETSEVLLLEKASKYKFFLESKSHVCCSSLEEISKTAFQKDNASSFDIILGLEILETEEEPERLLSIIKALLTQDGKLFLGADNRLGVRYLCGEKDPYTQRCFDGLDNYKDYQVGRALSGRCYAKAELKAILMRAGFGPKFYSVFPTLENPQLIIAEDYVPNERISARYSPMYRNPDTVFLQEEQICDDFAQNGIMHIMANSFLIECTLNNYFMDVKQVALSLNRGEENAQETIICSDRVEKKAIFSKGHKNLKNLDRNMQMLATHGISTVSGQWEGQTYVMPYMDAPLGNVYLQHLLREDADEFLLRMDQFKDLILQSSEIVDENESGMILKDGYIDMVPLNSFFQDGKFIFFDQEFCVHNYPVNAILYRAIIIVYEQMAEHEALVPIDLIWKRYGLNDRLDYLNALTTQFINDLRNYQELVTFYDTHMRNDWIADYNRERLDRALTGMNVYESYQGDNCFKGVEDKKIFLFGAGKWCDKFLDFYRNDNVYGILDNDEQKWGTEMHGIPIASPDSIVEEQEAYKVIICAKHFEPIFRQLKRMQVAHIGIYDATYYNRERLGRVVNKQDIYEPYQGDNCFKGVEDKKIFLFGAGRWCDKFLDFYRNDNVYKILDNDEQKWGTEMHGIPIASPDSIVGEQEAYKVIICAKHFEPIFRQLKRMQVAHIGIYDATYYNRERLGRVVNKQDIYEPYQGDNCFKELEDKKIFLFGAGKWCDKFLAFYKNDYNICRILDNDEQKWGTEMHGIPIASPDSIVGEQEAYKVIICAKRYEPIFRQLKRMQVIHIGIYDANYIYAGRQALNIVPSNGEKKKYHIGYISGTFDLFHIGHINILRRAKEQCDYLIAAVTADEYVRSHKNKEPTIPFGERAQVLSSCKYVDEVVGVPVNYVGTVEAFQKYHFDCQFCGSDCENDSWWLEQKDYLQRHGSDLHFFPYTEQTSSTKIRALIDKGLL